MYQIFLLSCCLKLMTISLFNDRFTHSSSVIPSSNGNTIAVYPGNLSLGALFPIHNKGRNGGCSTSMSMDGIFGLETFLFSLDKLNEELQEKIGFTLGAVVMDTCSSERHALVKALKFVLNDYLREENDAKDNESDKRALDVIGVVGPMKSSVAIQVANLFGLFKMPQISYAATSPTLSNKEIYPYFMRTVPSDINQAKVLVEILKFMNISYIVGVYDDTNYGIRGFQVFEKLVDSTNICFATKWKISTDIQLTSNYFRQKIRQIYSNFYRARAVVLYLHQEVALNIFQAAVDENLMDHFIWIGPDGWGNRFFDQKLSAVAEGAIVSLPVYKTLPGFQKYFYSLKPSTNRRNPWFHEFWATIFNCSFSSTNREKNLPQCDETKPLKVPIVGTEFGMLHFVRDAVYAFGNALVQMHDKYCDGIKGLCDKLQTSLQNLDAYPLIDYLKNGTFKGVDGRDVYFMDGQDGLPVYSVANYQKVKKSNYKWIEIATFSYMEDTTNWIKTSNLPQFKLDNPSFPTSVCGTACPIGYVRRYKQDKCCWECELCAFPMYQNNETCDYCITANANQPPFYEPNSDGSGCKLLKPTYVHFDNPFVVGVACLSVVGLLLVISTGVLFFRYSNTPIIKASGRELSSILLLGIILCYTTVFIIVLKPTIYTCAFSRFLYSLGYTVSYAAIFIKNNRIARIFRQRNPRASKKPKYVSPMSQVFIVLCLVGFQSILNTVWLILKPSTPVYQVELNYDDQKIVVHYFCEAFKDEDMLIALLFPICLLILSAVYAFKTRKIPGRFNETKFIIITTYTTCIVWLAFVPVFFSTEKIPLRIYSLCAALVLNATVTLICMFLPKLYVALCRPHKNTKDSVMGRKSVVSLSSWSKKEENGYQFTGTRLEAINSEHASDKYYKLPDIESSALLRAATTRSAGSMKNVFPRKSL